MPESEPTEQPRSMVVQRPKSGVYTALLGISVLALAIGCLFLLLEWSTYSNSFSPFQLYDAVGGP